MSNNKLWYALYIDSDYEKKVMTSLVRRKIEYYYPINQVSVKLIGTQRKTNQPLFPGFMFVKVNCGNHESLIQLSGVLSIVHWLKEPAVFDNEDIEMIRQFINVHTSVKQHKIAVNMFDKAKVVANTLTEQQNGEVLMNIKQVQLFLPSLGCILSAEVEKGKIGITKKLTSQTKTFETTELSGNIYHPST